jgi:hypothetical protein
MTFKGIITFSRPAKAAFWYACTKIKDPVSIRFFIMSFVWCGTIAFVYLCSMLGISPLITLLSLNLSISYWFNTEAIFYTAGSWGSLCWAFSLMSLVLFLLSYKSKNKFPKISLFILSIISYWIGVTRNPQSILIPFMAILITIYISKNRRDLKDLRRNFKPHIRNNLQAILNTLSYVSLTVLAFLIRWFAFRVEIHNYLKQAEKHFSFLGIFIHPAMLLFNTTYSFFKYTLSISKLPYLLIFSIIITLAIYLVILYLKRNTDIKFLNNSMTVNKKEKNHLFIQVILLSGVILTLITLFNVNHTYNRYYFSPSIYLTILLTVSIHFRIQSKAKNIKRANSIYIVTLIFLILLSTYNRYIHIDKKYTAKAQYYSDLSTLVKEDINMSNFPHNHQTIIIGHPAYNLTKKTKSYQLQYRSSSGLLKIITDRHDITGFIIEEDYSFNVSIFNYLKRDISLSIYIYKNNRLESLKYLTENENNSYNLYKLRKNDSPELIYSDLKRENIFKYMNDNDISLNKLWMF